MAVKGVKIQVGQQWETRGGEETTIIQFVEHSSFPWVSDKGCSYTNDGSEFEGGGSVNDLIELLCAPGFVEKDRVQHTEIEAHVQMLDLPAEGAYVSLADVLKRAYEQAASGKGKERHASGDTPFEQQPMATINRQLGSIDGFIYQAHKKSLEAKRLPNGRAQAELLGAINYLAGAVIALDTWANTEGGT